MTDAASTYTAAYATDGNSDSDFTSLSCMHTNLDTNPWWAVDLRVPLYVHSVKFTNRHSARTYVVFHMSVERGMALITVSGPQALSLAAVVLTRAHWL